VIFDPPSGAHNTISAVSGINETVTATCREYGWTFTFSQVHDILPYYTLHGPLNIKFYRPSFESHLLDLDVKGKVGLDTGVTEK